MTLEFFVPKDGLKLGEVPGTMDDTIRILDLNCDLYWLMAQTQQGLRESSVTS